MFDKIKRRIRGIEFYRIYFKPLGEQTGWSKYSDEYDGMPAPIPQDRFFDIEDPPKNRIYLCVGIKSDGKWSIGSEVPGTWKRKWGDDESGGGESKAELKKRLEKLEKSAENKSTPSTEEIAGIILWNHIEKKVQDGEDIWGVIGGLLNPQPNNSNNPYDMFDTNIKVEGNMPWWAHPGIVNMYTHNLPELAENLSSSFIKGARKEMAKLDQQRQPLQQQPPQEVGYAEEGAEPAGVITEEEGPLDIEVRPKSNTVARILAERAAEKEAMKKTTVAEEEVEEKIPSEARAAAERFDAQEDDEGAIEAVPKSDIKELRGAEEPLGAQTEEEEKKPTLIAKVREKIATKKETEVEDMNSKSNIKEQIEPETEGMPDVGIGGKGKTGETAEEEETEEEIAKKEMIRKRTEKAMATRARNKAERAREEAEAEEIEVEA